MAIRKVKGKDGKTVWEVRYHVNGRGSKRMCFRFDTKANAEAHMEQRTIEKRQFKLAESGVQTFEETTFQNESEYWLSIQGARFSPGHLKRVQGVLAKLLPRIGNLPPTHLHPGFLTRIQSELLSSGLKPATVNRDLEVVTAILNFSAKHRRIPMNPAMGFQKLPEVRDDIHFWEREEAERFLAFANKQYPFETPSRWVYVAYLLALNTGLRAGEIWGLKPSDIKENREVLHIQRQYDRIKRVFRPTKGKENRRVPCNAELLRELHTWLEDALPNPDGTVFQTETGRPICHDNFKKRKFNKDVAAWGGKPIRFHDLRHTGITLMIANGLDLKTVQDISGHKDIKTTMKYAHLLGERIQFAARTFVVSPKHKSKEGNSESLLRLVK